MSASRVFDPFDFLTVVYGLQVLEGAVSWPGVEIEGCSRFIVDIYL
jgi:hypothetical protein